MHQLVSQLERRVSCIQNTQLQTFKLLVILLFTSKVASGSPAITPRMFNMASGSPAITPRMFNNLLLRSRWCWALLYIYRITRTVKSSARTGVLVIRLCLHSQANLSSLSSCLVVFSNIHLFSIFIYRPGGRESTATVQSLMGPHVQTVHGQHSV